MNRGQGIEDARHALVNELVQRRVIRTPAVERAFRRVYRHTLLPSPYLLSTDALLTEFETTDDPCRVYSDLAVGLAVDLQVYCNAPSILAMLVEQLAPTEGMRVLHVGAAAGYCTAILAELVGERGTVVGVADSDELAELSAGGLAQAGYTNVTVRQGDALLGVPEAAPFDRILVSAGISDIAPSWIRQLGDEGTLVLPLCPASPLEHRASGGPLLAVQKSGDILWGGLSTTAFIVPLLATRAPASEDGETLADGLARWLALEAFLRVDVPIRIALKPTSAPPPHPGSVPWMLETRSAVMWIEPS